MKKQKRTPAADLLRYCVGIDVGKDTLHLCVSAIDADGKASVKGSRQFPNRVPAFEVLEAWCAKHCRDESLPVRYLMESTGVYHEQIAWHLFRADRQTSVVLPNKANRSAEATLSDELGPQEQERQNRRPGLGPDGSRRGRPSGRACRCGSRCRRKSTRCACLPASTAAADRQRLQELKNQSQNQQHAIMHSQIVDPFIIKQLNMLIKLYDKQVEQIGEQIDKLLSKDAVLKAKIDQICQIKGLGLLSAATIVAETNGFAGFDRTGAPECPPAREFRRIRRR